MTGYRILIYIHIYVNNIFNSFCSVNLLFSSTITLVGGKKRKRNASSDHSDGELNAPATPSTQEDLSQVRLVRGSEHVRVVAKVTLHTSMSTKKQKMKNYLKFSLKCRINFKH